RTRPLHRPRHTRAMSIDHALPIDIETELQQFGMHFDRLQAHLDHRALAAREEDLPDLLCPLELNQTGTPRALVSGLSESPGPRRRVHQGRELRLEERVHQTGRAEDPCEVA